MTREPWENMEKVGHPDLEKSRSDTSSITVYVSFPNTAESTLSRLSNEKVDGVPNRGFSVYSTEEDNTSINF